MEEPLRIRAVFADRRLLSASQRWEGLKRCWLLLRPGTATIADLESSIRTSFRLESSCPHGLILSIDGFVLPSFESTCILKDKDIIRIKKKNVTKLDEIDLGSDPCCIEDYGGLENQHMVSCNKLLAIKEFGEDSCRKRKHYEDGGSPSKSKNKRKRSDETKGPRMKRLKIKKKETNVSCGKDEDVAEEVIYIHPENTLASPQGRGSSRKSLKKKDRPSTTDGRSSIFSHLDNNVECSPSLILRGKRRKKSNLIDPEQALVDTDGAGKTSVELEHSSDGQVKHSDEVGRSDDLLAFHSDENVNKNPTPVLMEKRNIQVEEDNGGNTRDSDAHGSVAKSQSRSARRKKAKRQWLQELKSQSDQSPQMQISTGVSLKEPSDQQQIEQNAEEEKELVPVVIRPGHIRFQPLGEEQNQWEPQETRETLQWTGTDNKKKGQKWGREKTASKWNDGNVYAEQSNRKAKNIQNDVDGHSGLKWAGEKTVIEGNDATSYHGQKWAGERKNNKWNDTHKEQFSGKENMNRWTDANGYTEHCNGKGKTVSKWSGVNGFTDQSNGKEKVMNGCTNADGYIEQSNTKAGKWNSANGSEEQAKKTSPGKAQTGSSPVDFESLFPLTRIPQVGDLIAYRLIELSSSWCPEVSPFRVGQVTSYNYINLSIILVPVPEFPLFSEEEIERRESMQADSSLYKEDGSLQIHYPSLIDVRLLKASSSESEPSTPEAAPANKWERAVGDGNAECSGKATRTVCINNSEPAPVNSNAEQTVPQSTENGTVEWSGWDQIKQALNEKKAELQKEKDGWDEWKPNKSSGNTSWSYRSLRRGALGPTLAYLRGGTGKPQHGKQK